MTAPLTVDVTGWFISQLTPRLTSARVAAERPPDPDGLLGWIPFVQVIRVGGPNDNIVIDAPTMAFHCYAATPKEANELGYAVINAVRQLRGAAAAGAILTAVRTLSGPAVAPTENPKLRHTIVLLQARIKTTG